jgi:hypothetical protein
MQDDTLERQEYLEVTIKELESVNKKLAKLTVLKEELTGKIISAFGHQHEGQRSYEFGMWKVEIKTPSVYSLDKKLYESIDYKLLGDFNPIRASVAYSIDKKACDSYIQDAPKKIRDMLVDLIDKKPGKPGVTIKSRV